MTTKPTLNELLVQLAERLEANKGKKQAYPFASAKDILSGPPAIHPCRIHKGMGTNYYGNTVVIR